MGNEWTALFIFMIKLIFILLVTYQPIRSILSHIINNIYGGMLAVEQERNRRE